MRVLVVWVVGVVGAVGAAGCGPSSWDDFRNQLGDRVCAQAVRCGELGASQRGSACPVPSDVLARITPSGMDVDAALKDGRMQFNSDGAQDCLDAVGGSPCDLSALELRIAQRCHHVIAPNVGPGHTCRGAGECVGGQCAPSGFDCVGTCTSYPSPGAPCDRLGSTGMTCDPTVQYCGVANPEDGGATQPTVCLRHKQRGEVCDADEQCSFGLVCVGTCGDLPHAQKGDVCTAPGTLCDEEVYCDTTGHCAAVKSRAEACDTNNACKKGFACIGLRLTPPSTVTPGVCQPWLDVGQPCDATGGQVSGCPNGFCQDGVCVGSRPPNAGPRQSCVTLTCADGLYCDGARCQYVANGRGDCTRSPLACARFLTCDLDTHRCSNGLCN
jgi:hypothetical protein